MRQFVQSTVVIIATIAGIAAAPGGARREGGPLVPRLRATVQTEIDTRLSGIGSDTLGAMMEADPNLQRFALPAVARGKMEPWERFARLEEDGLRSATAVTSPHPVSGILDILATIAGWPVVTHRRSELTCRHLHEGIVTLRRVLAMAEAHRQQALAAFTDSDRRFLFGQAASLALSYGPTMSPDNETAPAQRQAAEMLDGLSGRLHLASMYAAAQVLAGISDPRFLGDLRRACQTVPPVPCAIPGVTGPVLHAEATPLGWLIIGGWGNNSYTITDQPIAAIIDPGGNDSYSGIFAASFDVDRGNSLVIDCGGDDSYSSTAGGAARPFGMATGRLGVGMLIDCTGNDRYSLADGTGGAGFGGIGILWDQAGNDTYAGTSWCQGAAIAGIGLLLDTGGNDTHAGELYSIGFGGALGVGAMVDAGGDDSYQCGRKYPAGDNRDGAAPGDAGFEYEGWGMGAAMGRRLAVSPNEPDASPTWQLAGGIGLLVDIAGNDRYDGSNHTQGCGYYGGEGLVIDLAGNDLHTGGRYALGAGITRGIGLAIDVAGNDSYLAAGFGPFCGAALDRGAGICLDAGGDDKYQSALSPSFGVGEDRALAIFADLGGRDSYAAPSGLGRGARQGLGIFLTEALSDFALAPDYGDTIPVNRKTMLDGEGGLFISRPGWPSPK